MKNQIHAWLCGFAFVGVHPLPSQFAQAAQISLHQFHELALFQGFVKIREIGVKGASVSAFPRCVYPWSKISLSISGVQRTGGALLPRLRGIRLLRWS